MKERIAAEQRADAASAQKHEASIALDREKMAQFSKIREQVSTVDGRLITIARA